MSEYGWAKEVQKLAGEPGVHDLMGYGGVEKSTLYAEFHMLPVHLKARSEKEGRPVYEDMLHIKVFMPGGDVMCRRVEETDKHKWPEAWEIFQRGETKATIGLPLEEWPQIVGSAGAMLKANNVFSVENLAALSDAHCETIGGFSFDYREKAKAYLDKAQGADIQTIKDENAALKAQMAEMQEAIKEMQKPKRRGRPRKVKQNEPVAVGTGHDGPDSGNTAT